MGRLADKRIIVTGGANGLGSEYVRALHDEGALVAIADRDVTAGPQLAEELGERVRFVEIDVTKADSILSGFAVVAETFGGIDGLINNAGIYPHKAFIDIGFDDWQSVMRTNLDSVFLCTKAAVPYLEAAGGGKVVNIITNLVWVLAPDMAHYIASKAGVLGFTRGAARELAERGITINALAPGANLPAHELDERGIARMREVISYQSIKRPQFACDLTGAIVFLCSTDSDFMTGQVICIDGGVVTH